MSDFLDNLPCFCRSEKKAWVFHLAKYLVIIFCVVDITYSTYITYC